MSHLLPQDSTNQASVAAAVLEAGITVFADAGLELVRSRRVVAAEVSGSDPAAVIGFAGSLVAGTLTLVVPWKLLDACHPSGAADKEDCLDWLREMSNLLLGRLKIKFQRHDLALNIGIPTSVVGERIAFDTTPETLTGHILDFGSAEAVVLFNCVLDPSVDWRTMTEPPPSTDNEMLFF